ncbi:putative N-acetyltransferase YhbS [Altererythrobacter atlanticus]|uniref:TDP-fucosamine acetyltransferase n=1 Tax=Croceibacterium atlanticum TaxID=1267766 RepID=A0A0F7KMU6_9SPHN|nr:GNAT family N-acetyltransferase [Croceibacterium atlanticum]AKH41868.2 TDP-fucosamine acetyltransferase [Croceibacterium atlanticum]MBB5733569.1 putative N-acetyltransferase YhbS [Croceibacterium atlanticum]
MNAIGAADIMIRKAQEQDIPALHKLVESAYRGDSAKRGWTHEADLLGGQRTDVAALREIIGHTDQVILLAMDGADIAGCVQLVRVDEAIAYLGLLTVDPDRQAAGLGKILINEAERFAAGNWQARAMEMTVIRQRGELIAYYQRRGYVLTEERRPFPLDDPRYGLPKTQELEFAALRKNIGA